MKTNLRQQGFKDLAFTSEAFDKELYSVRHGFFGRKGGVSQGIFSSLNCGEGSSDKKELVQENKNIILSYLQNKTEDIQKSQIDGRVEGSLLTLHQIHSNICYSISNQEDVFLAGKRPQADSLVTNIPGLALAVLTADCAPVLFFGQSAEGPVIGAAHAGWSGALKGITTSTIQNMRDLGAHDIYACIGPCIGSISYEVGQEFKEEFLKEDAGNDVFFENRLRSKHLINASSSKLEDTKNKEIDLDKEEASVFFDLPSYLKAKLQKDGVKKIHAIEKDTYAHEDDFYSYRRATHKKEDDYGRQISAIMIVS